MNIISQALSTQGDRVEITKAVIPVAGLGTRFLPATLTIPKSMIPVLNKPPIHYCVKEASLAGIDHVVFVVSQGQESISEYFNKRTDLENILKSRNQNEILKTLKEIHTFADISVVVQENQLGLGDAILKSKKHIGSNPFAVFLPDDLIFSDQSTIKPMIDIHNETGGMVLALKHVLSEQIPNLGIADIKNNNDLIDVLQVIEKPSLENAPSNFGIIGRYILTPNIFDAIATSPKGILGEIQLTDAIQSLISYTKCNGYEFPGEHFDVGTPMGMLKASIYVALKTNETSSELKTWLESII